MFDTLVPIHIDHVSYVRKSKVKSSWIGARLFKRVVWAPAAVAGKRKTDIINCKFPE